MTLRVPLQGMQLDAPRLELPAATSHYLRRVRRLTDGAVVVAFDGRGHEIDACLTLSGPVDTLVPCGPLRTTTERPRVRLLYALPKGGKVDDILRPCTELGVTDFVLFAAERSVVHLDDPERAHRKMERWQRVVEAAARQSGRADVPTLRGPLSLSEALESVGDDPLRLVLDPKGDCAWSTLPRLTPATVIVGPEGGLSPRELLACDRSGFSRVPLGCPILRTETAAIVGPTLLLAHVGAL